MKFFEPSFSYIIFSPVQPVLPVLKLGQVLGPSSIGYWAYLLRAFLQARAFEPVGYPFPLYGQALRKKMTTLTDLR